MSMPSRAKVLFLCTGNSTRSIMGEFLLRKLGGGKFETFSAGAHPRGEVHPATLRVLREIHKIDASGARSKPWSEFEGQAFDFVITVCDDARESCPVWPGQPIVAHWSSPDPAKWKGSDEEIYGAFVKVSFQIRRRVELFTCLPLEKLDRLRMAEMTREIGDDAKAERATAV